MHHCTAGHAEIVYENSDWWWGYSKNCPLCAANYSLAETLAELRLLHEELEALRTARATIEFYTVPPDNKLPAAKAAEKGDPA